METTRAHHRQSIFYSFAPLLKPPIPPPRPTQACAKRNIGESAAVVVGIASADSPSPDSGGTIAFDANAVRNIAVTHAAAVPS